MVKSIREAYEKSLSILLLIGYIFGIAGRLKNNNVREWVAMQKYHLTKIDLQILKELQRDGRITYSALGDKVGLSTSPCIERVKKMERAGIIRGYSAQLKPSCLNAGLVVFVEICLDRKSHEIFRRFRDCVEALDQVQQCFLVCGKFDYLIKVRIANMEEYREFLGNTLLSLPGVRESASYVVMEEIKDTQIVSIERAFSLINENEGVPVASGAKGV